ncbi:kinase-like domain-containing protein [Rhizophagus irregularis DAOM 181602=DAOM 197198]|nr:kinase-like domain-containing protein [Rhizophagus irregularis DAOM 181602=DAOM 197198]
MIVEWIPYENFQNIKYLTKGGCSEIYTAIWIDGHYFEWNPKQKQLKRFGTQEIVLKGLGNIENSSKDWFDEAKSHLTISNKWASIVQCYGITQDPSDENYMLVMLEMAIDLRKYLQKNHKQLTWKKRIQITNEINLSYQNTNEFEANDDIEIIITSDFETTETNYANSLLSTSKIYQFENLFEPKNATEEEQEAFHSKPYDFEIPNNINKLS